MKNFINNIKAVYRTRRIEAVNKAIEAHEIIRIDGLNSYTTSFDTRYEAKHFAKTLRRYITMNDYNVVVSGKIVRVRRK